jgi:hypothetical protein
MGVAAVGATVIPENMIDPSQAKAAKAGAQFEAILLNLVFGDLQKTFSQLPGTSQDPISKSYAGFGMEALTTGLARNGGIGLGSFITKALLAHSKQNSEGV